MFSRIRESTKVKKSLYAAIQAVSRIDPAENLLLFCMPRGGSTWLMEVLAKNTNLPVLWEPLHLRYAPAFHSINLGWEQVMYEDAEWPELEATFDRLFRGKILNDWNCQISPAKSFLLSNRMIVKFCRANGMLQWLTSRFSFKHKPVFLVRHPFAVVASQMRHKGFDRIEARMSVPQTPHNDFFVEHKDFLESIDSKPQRQVAVWCVQNLFALQTPKENRRWITVYYEDLLEHANRELQKVTDAWDLQLNERFLEDLRRPSMSTIGDRSFSDTETQLSRWRQAFSDEEIEKMLSVLNYFGVKTYGYDLRPIGSYL